MRVCTYVIKIMFACSLCMYVCMHVCMHVTKCMFVLNVYTYVPMYFCMYVRASTIGCMPT